MKNTFDLSAHAGFYPAKSLDDKKNYRSTFRIDVGGSVTQVIRLRVLNDHLREEIICIHFLSSYVRWIIKERVEVAFKFRDEPWDFRIGLSNDVEFNLEITAVAEGREQFRQRANENRLGRVISEEVIPLSLLRKIQKDFPNQSAQEIIDTAITRGAGKNDKVRNPWHAGMEPIYTCDKPVSDRSLCEQITDAVSGKTAKKHDDKHQTILLIDNRSTTFELEDLQEASLELEKRCPDWPFKEVWFYTGYYSDDDGGNAEWILAPIWLPKMTMERFTASVERSGTGPNKAGLIFGGF